MVHTPRYCHLLSSVLCGNPPQQVHVGVVIIVILSGNSGVLLLRVADVHVTVSALTEQRQRTINLLVASHPGVVVAARDIVLHSVNYENVLRRSVSFNLDFDASLHYPAVSTRLAIYGESKPQLV